MIRGPIQIRIKQNRPVDTDSILIPKSGSKTFFPVLPLPPPQGSITKVAAFASVASRLAHFTDVRRHWWRNRGSGTTVPDVSKTIINNSSLSSSVSLVSSPQQQPLVGRPTDLPIKPSATPSSPLVCTKPSSPLPQRAQMPVTASVEIPDQLPDPPVSRAEASPNFCTNNFFHIYVCLPTLFLLVSASVRVGRTFVA
ncbi:unnamed protein product [Dibothriocephalus latus]|uniref:Uncharacterized protein n=1 Tax=Dibothriocephalus latus TaxID=60516 RepID=A0A3P6QA25_DIBLA|nr:unnamed protein product [Dibothriocephalus latus]